MKRKAIFTAMLIVAFSLLLIVLIVVRDSQRMAWSNWADYGVASVARAIEAYRDDNGRYPSALEDLSSRSAPEMRSYLQRMDFFYDRFGDRYEYAASTNGFVICIIRPDRWFLKGDRLERRYKIGEALR
jgi:hypothetical protein